MSIDNKEFRSKLVEQAKLLNLRMPQVQTLLSQERFIARLMQVEGGRAYIWKGGSLILRMYQHLETPRFTVDIDFAVKDADYGETDEIFNKAINLDLEDGFRFFNITKSPMIRETPYGGDRYEIQWTMFEKEQSESLKIDVCAGDDVDPESIDSEQIFLVPIDKDVSMQIYPPEFIFAEKLETADRFYTGNTRLKDFIDLWSLMKHGLDVEILKQAIKRCYKRRGREFDLRKLTELFNDAEYIALMEQSK